LTKHLLEREWNVIQADINPPKENLDNTRFVKCTIPLGVVSTEASADYCQRLPGDVSSWDQNTALFQKAYEFTGRLDFCALNAGIDDRDDIFKSLSKDPNKPPKKPNMKVGIPHINPLWDTKTTPDLNGRHQWITC
jgi:NAD(P)-dependent dehydrogenase (short-subunit alcohol dehydrogenase family)